jgi:uncharacterized lipoprotein YajG
MSHLPLLVFIVMARKRILNVSLFQIIGFVCLFLFVNKVGAQNVYISKVENNIKIGKFAGSRNLAFGCKNIFQEILQDKNYSIVGSAEEADLIFNAQILYFDVDRTKRNVSVFHSDVEETLVVMKGILTDKSGKKVKEADAKESSSEISTSTLITDAGSDKINQQALSSAIKKTCESLINKTFIK